MSPEAWIPIAITIGAGLWAAYKYRDGKKEKSNELLLQAAVNKTNAETSQTEMLTRAQQAFADDLIKYSGSIRLLASELEQAKLADLKTITDITKQLLEVEIKLRKETARKIELEEELAQADDEIKIAKMAKLDLETNAIVMKARIEQLELEVNRTKIPLIGGIDDVAKS